jgi:crotonobetainyl-CoA:carnitine CoA-transferase CaiB-like acyl-CoA transferase
VLERLAEKGVPCCPCSPSSFFCGANDLWWRSEHGLFGPIQQIGAIIKWREHSMRLERPAPLFAQHSREVLQDY